ncbi:MAG: lipid II flippase MurJ [Terracidiphilus sp.]|nr:lipid II flippase MurJ [Terracidiphilus sp.]
MNLVVTLVNQIVLAYLFGAGASMDAFLACGAVPFVVLNLAIGDLGYVLVPLLMEYEKKDKVTDAVNSSFSAISLLSLVVTLLGILGHRWVLRMTTASNMPAQTFDLAVSIAPLMWVVIGLTIMGSYLTGIHYYRREFTQPSVTLAFPYLGMIVGGLLGARQIGILAVVLGWVAGTFLRDVVLYITLCTPRARLTLKLFHPATWELLKTLPPLGVSLLPFTALPMIDVYWASRLPVGSISYLGYSNRIVIALASIVVQGLSVVLFPDMSEDIAKGDFEAFRLKVSEAIKVIFLAIVPLAIFVAIVRMPVLAVVLQRGKFSVASSEGVAKVLPLYLFGVVWMAMMNIVIRSYYALQEYLTPAKIGTVALILYIVLPSVLINRFSYLSIGIAYSVFWFVMFFLQGHFLGKKVGPILNCRLLEFFGKVLLSSLFAAGLLAATGRVLGWEMKSTVALVAQGAGSLVIFVAISYFVFRLPQYNKLLEVIRSKLASQEAR